MCLCLCGFISTSLGKYMEERLEVQCMIAMNRWFNSFAWFKLGWQRLGIGDAKKNMTKIIRKHQLPD